jgi:hypothetical protein
VVIFFLIIVFSGNFSCSGDYEASPVKKINAPAPPIAVGATGKLLGMNYHVTAHAVVEIAEQSARFERHEYQLTDDGGQTGLLICGMKPDDHDWTLFTPLYVPLPSRPQEFAAKKTGDLVTYDGVAGIVQGLFLSTTRQTDGAASLEWQAGNTCFGFDARGKSEMLLARWNNLFVNVYRGTIIPAREATNTFALPPKP